MRPIVRGAAAVLAAPALLLPAFVATSAPASAATDPAPATAAGTWLAGQLTDGLVHNQQYDFDDYGLTVDVALGLDAVGAPATVVADISDALAADIDAYTRPVAFGTNLSAGASAKAIVLAAVAGDDPRAYGGRDLVADLESRVATEGPIAGRIQDDFDPATAADYSNVFGQAYAAQALDAVGSDDTDAVTDFLLAQQCSAGFFRQDFAALDAADQTCDGGAGRANVDATALTITALQSQLDDTDVKAAVDDAVAWLVGQQNDRNGGFGSNADLPAANANSTGAAAYALLLSGADEEAEKAAAWLRAHQLTNVANCVYYDSADTGAVVYDGAALTAAWGAPMDVALADQSVRATADALPGLLAAQAGSGAPQARFTAEYVKAGGSKPIGVVDAAPGEAVCAMLGEQSVLARADVTGDADLRVRIPARTRTHQVRVANAAGVFDTVEIKALGRKKLAVSLKKRVPVRAKQTIVVRGLAPGESTEIEVVWPSTRHGSSGSGTFGRANRKGVFRATYKVGNRPGVAKVKVRGEFANRRAKASFVVTR